MHDGAIEHGAAAQRIAARRDALAQHEFGQLARIAVARGHAKRIAVELEDVGAVGLAQPRRRFDQRVEHGLQVEAAAADELEDVGRRPQRLLAVLDLGDVVTDRQHAAIRQAD